MCSKLISRMCAFLALLGLCTACVADEFGERGGKEEVTFSTVLPSKGASTRAFGDGAQATELWAFVYQGDTFVTKEKGEVSGLDGTVTVQLAKGVSYNIVFWAGAPAKTTYVEADPAEAPATPYTINYTSGALKVNYDAMDSNSDANDAFCTAYSYTAGSSDATTGIALKRPFAQLNFGTDDLELDAVKKAYNGQVYANVEFSGYKAMNLKNSAVEESSRGDFATRIALSPITENLFEGDAKTKWVHMGYVLAPKSNSMLSDCKLNVYTTAESGSKLHTVTVPAAPLQANFKTNVYGSLLSTTTDFTVEIAPAFEPVMNNMLLVESSAAIMSAFEAAKRQAATSTSAEGPKVNVKLGSDMAGETIALSNEPTPEVAAPKPIEVNIDLQGHEAPVFDVKAGVTLNVYNSGTVSTPKSVRGKTRASNVKISNETLFYAHANATINIHEGSYATQHGTPCLVVDGGEASFFTGTLAEDNMQQWIYNPDTGSVTQSKSCGVVQVRNGGRFTQYGGRIDAPGAGSGVEVDNGTASLESGEIWVVMTGGNNGYCVNARNHATVNVKGTNLNASYSQYLVKADAASVEINGGVHTVLSYTPSLLDPCSVVNEGSVLFKGGAYSFNPNEGNGAKYLAPGRVATQNGSHWYIATDSNFFEGSVKRAPRL